MQHGKGWSKHKPTFHIRTQISMQTSTEGGGFSGPKHQMASTDSAWSEYKVLIRVSVGLFEAKGYGLLDRF